MVIFSNPPEKLKWGGVSDSFIWKSPSDKNPGRENKRK